MMDFIVRRTTPLIHASMHSRRILETAARSCYLQGLIDAEQALEARSQKEGSLYRGY